MVLAPGLVLGIPAYSVKVHAKFPGQDPAIRGILVLHDLASGAPLALMESNLTALRTGLAGALAAEALSVPEARTVAIQYRFPISCHVTTGLDGAFGFRTIVPDLYSGRTRPLSRQGSLAGQPSTHHATLLAKIRQLLGV